MQLIITHPIRWLVALMALATLSLGVAATASHAGSGVTPNCDLNGDILVEPGPSEAGGQLVSWITECTGSGTVQHTFTRKSAGQVVFKVVLDKSVHGSFLDASSIHLPPLPTVDEEVCVDETCVSVPPTP